MANHIAICNIAICVIVILFTSGINLIEASHFNVDTKLDRFLRQAKDDADCILPDHPLNGKWAVFGQGSSHSPGGSVKSNTILHFDCNANYKLHPEVEGFGLYKTCNNGNWGGDFPKCIKICKFATCDTECGRTSLTPTALNKRNVEKGDFPWQVALYFNKTHICSGSIVSAKVILSAAHCFISRNWNKYQVGAGKLYRTFEHPEDSDAQYINVLNVKIPQEFQDGPYLAFDIALIILQKNLHLNKFVQPICLDVLSFHDSSLANSDGLVPGWGYNKHSKPSEILKKIEVYFQTTKECKANLPPDFKTYYTPYVPDKMCAGVSSTSDERICQGDTGGSLAFRKKADSRFYVRGIVSAGPNTECATSNITLYTSVSYHRDFILAEIEKYRNV